MTAPTEDCPRASRRARAMPASMFHAMDAAKCEARARGLEILDLSIGSSDLAAPEAAMEAVRAATRRRETHGYCLPSATLPLRRAAAEWYRVRYGVELDPNRQVLPLIGAQEGFAHLVLAVADPGDVVLAPDPGYPSWFGAFALAGVETHALPLVPERAFLPDLGAVPDAVARRARVMVLSYPNNPTAAVAPPEFLRDAVAFCRERGILLVHDFPYADMTFGGYEAPSVLAVPGAADVAVELCSCSKSFHMGGFRIGWAAGDAGAVAALRRVKGAIDFDQWLGIQDAAVAALRQPREETRRSAAEFERRRDALVAALRAAGWDAPLPRAGMYVWTRIPGGSADSYAFASDLARATGVCVAPGRGFGPAGEGFVRFALVREPAALERAVSRIREFTRRD